MGKMTSKERVKKTLEFNSPDRIPIDVWVLPRARILYGKDLTNLLKENPIDFARTDYGDPYQPEKLYQKGIFKDALGCVWENLADGSIGETKYSPLADKSDIGKFKLPRELADKGFENVPWSIEKNQDKFILGVSYLLDPFERMQFVRGVVNFFMDIAEESKIFKDLLCIFSKFTLRLVKNWMRYDIDGLVISDDWGSQQSMLISPESWRKYFKPMYREIFSEIHRADKYVFFHSDGNIIDIYSDLIEIGVDAINSQIFLIGPEKVKNFKGKITFWGEMDRQKTMPCGLPNDIVKEAQLLKRTCFENGGLIAQAEFNSDVPLENMKAFFRAWIDRLTPFKNLKE